MLKVRSAHISAPGLKLRRTVGIAVLVFIDLGNACAIIAVFCVTPATSSSAFVCPWDVFLSRVSSKQVGGYTHSKNGGFGKISRSTRDLSIDRCIDRSLARRLFTPFSSPLCQETLTHSFDGVRYLKNSSNSITRPCTSIRRY